MALAFVCLSFLCGSASGQVQQEWRGLSSVWTNSANWNPPSLNDEPRFPGDVVADPFTGDGAGTDIAFFGNNSASANVGIDQGTKVGQISLGGLGFGGTKAWVIFNSSSSASGILQLNGSALNNATGQQTGGSGTKYMVVSDNQTNDVTINNNNNGGSQTMSLQLGAISGEFYVRGGRNLNINVAMTEALSESGFTKTGSGTMVLSQNSAISGGITISAGTLKLGDGGTTGSLAASGGSLTVGSGATLGVNRSDTVTFSSVIGNRSVAMTAGTLEQSGTGTLQINAALSVGSTSVSAGTLAVNSNLTTNVNVASGATLAVSSAGIVTGNVTADGTVGGSGTITGNLNMSAGGILAPGSLTGGSPTGTLSIGGDLLLGSGTILNFELNELNQTVGSGINDLIAVAGNLTLDGTLNIIGLPDSSFDAGGPPKTWTLFTYTSLTNNGLNLGTLPSGMSGGWKLDFSTSGKVNIVGVPEPSSVLLLGGLLAGAAALRRRRSA